ncbi:hypothetical protein [Massilia sp. NP310]|uniref:hypothetical protein n=1 Tax=Massilia sp. NP310 TaxID=2861282 RepID=UPI001C6272E5|nr:hypothetical protein [Massilia sp. NP310]QYG03996.1 hypothetical protein KY496_11760 [Massilia sp. NP310]
MEFKARLAEIKARLSKLKSEIATVMGSTLTAFSDTLSDFVASAPATITQLQPLADAETMAMIGKFIAIAGVVGLMLKAARRRKDAKAGSDQTPSA